MSLIKICYKHINSLSGLRSLSIFDSVVKSKGQKNGTQLSKVKFWDEIYQSKSSQTEWYLNSNKASQVVKRIINDKCMLHPDRMNIVLEIGCGTAPLTIPLIKTLRKVKSPHLVIGVVTDCSPSCIDTLKKQYSSDPKFHKIRPVFRDDLDISHDKTSIRSLTPIMQGVMCQILDVQDIEGLHRKLQYFPVTDPEFYQHQVGPDNLFETNIIVVDKGCLDALIWDGNMEDVGRVFRNCNSIVSISGEDPESRLEYFQRSFGKLFSVHFIDGTDIFAYSYSHEIIL